MTKIISFSLWGNNRKYTKGAVRNAELAEEIYPGWKCRFYTSTDVSDDIIRELQTHSHVEIVPMGEPGWNGMFWRFLAADSDDTMISRDTDSRLNHREKSAVDEWLNSDKDFHIMRDHPYHATEILGGMWGVRNGLLKGISKMITDYDRGELDGKYQIDQNFLRHVVYPLVKHKALVHDEFFEGKPFPVSHPRKPHYFVGQVYNEFNEAEF